jgi:cobalamin biosynthesis protein CobD/CbiB
MLTLNRMLAMLRALFGRLDVQESGVTAVGLILAIIIVVIAVALGVASHPLFLLLIVLAILVAVVL